MAVIRAIGYNVEWYFPDGSVVTGPETPYESIPISRADKEAELEDVFKPARIYNSTRSRFRGSGQANNN